MSSHTGHRIDTTRGTLALAAVGLLLAGCSASGQQKAAVLDAPDAPAPSATTTAPAADSPAFGGAASAGAALDGWLVALVKADYPAACKLMGQKGANGGPPTAPTQALCAGLAANKPAENLLAGLHKTFTPAGAKAASTTVVISGLTPTGPTAQVDDTQIKVDGKPLHDVVVANSKGLPAAKSSATFQISQIGKLWYVTDFALKS